MLQCKDFAKGTGFAIKNDTLKHKKKHLFVLQTQSTQKKNIYIFYMKALTNKSTGVNCN